MFGVFGPRLTNIPKGLSVSASGTLPSDIHWIKNKISSNAHFLGSLMSTSLNCMNDGQSVQGRGWRYPFQTFFLSCINLSMFSISPSFSLKRLLLRDFPHFGLLWSLLSVLRTSKRIFRLFPSLHRSRTIVQNHTTHWVTVSLSIPTILQKISYF